MFLPDIQSRLDVRQLAIQRVGVRGIVHPLAVVTQSGEVVHTVAHTDMFVGLGASVKGTHMSRFIEVLQATSAPMNLSGLRSLMRAMLERLEAERGFIEIRFPFFVNKTAPVSGVQSLMDYQVGMRIEQGPGGPLEEPARVTMEVQVPVTSLCPCSKEISDYGAHNQRSHITIKAELVRDIAVETLIGIAEQSASCELWGLLKRPDEKYVTERAYDNPKFVEDLVRDVALAVQARDEVLAFSVASENFESIHNHSAYACIEVDKRDMPAPVVGSC
jgi:GTP cyclohydrolase I